MPNIFYLEGTFCNANAIKSLALTTKITTNSHMNTKEVPYSRIEINELEQFAMSK